MLRQYMIRVLLCIAARGGLKLGPILLTISLFTALSAAVNAMSYSYANQAPIVSGFASAPTIFVSSAPTQDSIVVWVSTIKISGSYAILLSSEDIEGLIRMLHVRIEGRVPSLGQVLVGEGLSTLITDGRIWIGGSLLEVAGVIKAPKHLTHIMVGAAHTTEGWSGSVVYLTVQPSASAITMAPSLKGLVDGTVGEALTSLKFIICLLYALLALASAIQGYAAMVEARPVFLVFGALGASRARMAFAFALLSFTISASCVALGYAVGVFSSSLMSSSTSLILGLPHIKLAVGVEMLYVLGLAFVASSLPLIAGFVKGYASIVNRG